MGYYFLTKKNNAPEHIAPLTYSLWQKIGRALFAGSIITLAVYLSKTLHPFWGGVLSSFPATYSSTFIILRWYYDPGMLSKVARSIPFGSIIYTLYVLAVHWTYPAFGIIGGTVVAYTLCLIPFFLLLRFKKN